MKCSLHHRPVNQNTGTGPQNMNKNMSLCGFAQVYVVACHRTRVHSALLTWPGGKKRTAQNVVSLETKIAGLCYIVCASPSATHSESPKYQTTQERQKTSLCFRKKPLCLASHQCGPCEAPQRQSLKYHMKVAEVRSELLWASRIVSRTDEASLFLC